MLVKIIINSFRTDLRFISRDPMLLVSVIAPFLIVLLLRLLFPVISELVYTKTGFLLDKYYTIIAITMVSIIPMLIGIVYAFILLDESDMHILQIIDITPAGKKNFIYMRMIVPVFISFFMLLLSFYFTDPVPSEGWLRQIFISFLLSLQSSFVFLFVGCLSDNKIEGLALSKLYGVFLMAVPLGLILRHPWNYFAFFSPLYWISWAWVTPVPLESLAYGVISILITIGAIFIFLHRFLKKHTN